MSDYFWCHGPMCHTYATQDRIRGTKGSKVLRTRKIKQHRNEYYNVNRAWNYFCSQGCQNDFWNEYGNAIRQIAPRHEPLETKIEDPKKEKCTTSYGHTYYTHTINKIDNESNVG
jgi:hypothetical protein